MDKKPVVPTMEEVESEDDNSEIDLDFEFDDEIKESLDILLSVPLVFEDHSHSSDEEEGEAVDEARTKQTKGDSVERQLEELFVDENNDREGSGNKDTGLENISDIEFDGPESGECDTSDGELPDSPSIVARLPNIRPCNVQGAVDVSFDEESDVELLEKYTNKSRDYYDTLPQKGSVSKPERRVVMESRLGQENIKLKEKKGKDPSKIKVRSKSRDKKDKTKKKGESGIADEDMKRKLKLKKYFARLNQYKAKCLEYMNQISNKCDIKKDDRDKIKSNKMKHLKREEARMKSIVNRVNMAREISPHSSTSSKHDKTAHTTVDDLSKRRSNSRDKERKSKSEKKFKSKSKELKEHKIKYQKYIQYLQSERTKCFEEKVAIEKHKHKSKKKHRKSKSSSPEKIKDKNTFRPAILSFSEFCKSRELVTPEKVLQNKRMENVIQVKHAEPTSPDNLLRINVAVDSLATSSSAHNHIDHTDDDKELFITYSDLVEQDKIQENKKMEEEKKAKIDTILEKDPELQSISVFTSVLFKGSKDSEGIPFMEEEPPRPKKETPKPKPIFTQPSGPDEIYDWNDDLSTISQSSFSPSRSPAPKIHNKSILNYLENQKERSESGRKSVDETMSLEYSRSRSRSPKKPKLKSKKIKRKHYSSISVSPSPPPLKCRSPDLNHYKKRVSPPAYLKERWKDYPSPHGRKKEHHYERPSRSRRRSRSRTRPRAAPTHHRSRSSSEERHYRRHRTPSPAMVTDKRRKLRAEHEKALALLRASNSKSTTPLSLTFSSSGDNSEAVRDNYDPVVMNEDSSSPGVPDGAVEKSTPVLPPLPPGLPPEPPPVPPPPAVESTVITTYTSFVPLPNTNIMPPQHHPADMVIPMGYPDVHQIGPPPFNNWLGRNMQMSDMGANMQHHMYAQPPMLNNYDQFNAPPQQAFPFLNQPPPPLPYPMQMPPPCHQHYHMPNQGHSSNINLISIHQEIKNVNPKPVVITQFPDSLEKDFPQKTSLPIESGNKCKHNPLGQNNQTVQEAINSVKKCLKNCDGMKIKDPRLAPMETRSKSPDKFDTSSPTSSSTGQSDDRKVKIKLNYKPRPVSGVEQTSSLEPEFDTETTTKKSEVPNETVKANKYLEKNCKIEGIVSKLKDTIGTTSCTIEKSEFPPRSLNNDLKQSKDEPCNPENTDECVMKETSNVSTNSKKQSCIQNISAKETESQNSCSLDGKPSKHSTMKKKIGVKHSSYAQNQVIQKPDKTTQNEDKVIASGKEEHVNAPDLSRNNSVDKIDGQSQQKKVESNSREINDKQKISKPKRAVSSEQDFVSKAHKDCLSHLDNSVDNNTSYNTNNETKPTLALKSGQKTLSNVKNPSDKDKDTTDCNKSKVVDSNRNRKINTANQILESLTTEANSDIEQNISETQEIELKENPTINVKSTNMEKESGNSSYVHNSENVSEIEATASLLSLNIQQKVSTYTPDIEKEEFSSEIKHSIINENRAPVLSIPTKGELKRFPTPERTNKTTPKSFLDKKRVDKCNSFDTKDSKTRKNLDSNAIKPKTKEIEESSTNVVESILHDFEDSNSTGSDGQGSGKYKNESSKIKTKSSPLSNILTEISAESKEKMNKTDTLNPLVTQSSVDSLRSHNIQNDADNTKLPSQPLYQVKGSDSLLTVSEKNVNSESASQEVKKKETIPVNSDSSKEDENPVSKENSPGKELVTGKGDDCLTNTRRSKRKSKNESLIISHFTSDSMEEENNDSIDIEEASLNMLNSSKEPHTNLEDLGKKSLNDSLHITSETDSAEILNDHSSVKPISSVLRKPCPLSKKSYSYIEHNLPTSFDLSTDGHLIQKGFKKLRVSVEKCTTSLTAIKETHNVSSTLPKQSNSPEGYAKCTNDLKYDSKVKFDINDTLVKPQANFSKGNELTEEHTTKKLGVHLDKPTPDSLNDESVDSMSEHIESCDETSSNINDDNLVNNTLLHCTGNGQDIENNTELEDYVIEEGQDTISKPKSKKRVTFDMNIIEIKPNCYASLSNTAEEKEILIKKSNNQIERVVCINETPQSICDVLPQSDISSESHGVSEILEKSPLKADENVPKENYDKNLNQNKTLNSEQIMENYSNNILLYYNNIMKTLDIFKSSPLPNVEKRKSVLLTIPKPEDMPEAKILDSPKKAHKNKKKVNALENLDVCMNLVPIEKATISSENITEEVISKPLPNNKNLTEFISSENIREEIISKPLPSDKNLTELNNEQSKKLKNNNSRSEQNESDNDDSVILDRELSDLAKGCLDSDSTVGGDDDSVLNFGITAPENNTLAIKFDLSKDKTITSKLPTCEQSKLFSPRNIKKRFLKKIKSAVKNTESKTYLDILESSAQETPVTIQPRKKKLSLRVSEAQGHRSPNHRNVLISDNVNTASIDSDTNNPISDLDFIVDLKTKNAIKGVKSCKVYKKRRKRFRKKQHANLKKVSDIEDVNKLELKQRDACSPHFEIALDEKFVKVRDCHNTKKDFIVEKNINELQITVGTVKELDGNEFSIEGDLEEQNTFQEEIRKSVEDLKTNSISPLRKIRKTKNNVKCKLNDDHVENKSKIPDAPSDDFKDTSGLSKNLTVKANSIRNHDEEDLSHHITEPNLCAEEYIPEKTLKLSESRLRRTRKGKTVEQEIRSDCETMKEKPNKIISENDTENIIENKISSCDDKLGLTSQYTKVKSEIKGLEISLTISTQKTCSVKKADIGICHLVSLEATEEILEENVNKEKMSMESSKEEYTEKDTSSIFNTTHTRNKILNDNCVDKDTDINESFKVKKKGNKTMTKLKTETSLEAVSSPEHVRKTRAHPKKDISLHQDQTKCRDIVDESEYKVNTINQEDICETILKNKLKDITEFKLKTENVKCDLINKEDKLDIKERLLVSRSMSTDSIDEPLIFVKEKLLADKLEEEKSLKENKVCEDVEEKKNCNKLNDILKNINIQSNVKTCVSESSNSAGKSNEKESNSCNEDNIHKNTDSDKNQSSSSFNTFYNAGGKSSNNVYDVSSSDTSAEKVLPHPPLLTTDNVNKDVSQTDPDICSSFSNSSINIKSKDALRKKRDKAEVDAEIKRRLAEIDELEKLARSQHASLVDKIGVRTRSKAGNKNKSIDDDDDDDDDVVSISSDDSHNSLTSGSITPVDVKKSEDVINEEPTTTHEIETTKLIGEDCEDTKLKIDSLNSISNDEYPSSLSTDTIKKTRNKKENKMSEHELKPPEFSGNTSTPSNDNVETNSYSTSEKISIRTNKASSDGLTELSASSDGFITSKSVISKKSKQDLDNILPEIVEKVKNVSSSLREEKPKRARRNVVSVYQFRGTDDEKEPKIVAHDNLNTDSFSQTKHVSTIDKNKTAVSTIKLNHQLFQEVTLRKTRNKASINKMLCDKNIDYSPELEEKQLPCKSLKEPILYPEPMRNNSENSAIEPDSSTPGLSDNISTSPIDSQLLSVEIPETQTHRNDVLSAEHNIVEPSLSIQEKLPIVSSPRGLFREPCRKSLLHKKRKRRKSIFGRCINVPNNMVAQESNMNLTNESNDDGDRQSEEPVSSSDTSLQSICTKTKKRRRRKTVMDLLMEDSMLSVMRDFPMSPNPYMLPTFYKDIDISSQNNKMAPCNDSSVAGNNPTESIQNHEVLPKPDIISQKLRLLEKLKNISRKNRKTRQCRTLVCYNEDSLPESLVESPVGETTINNTDVSIIPQELISIPNTCENETNSSLSEKIDLLKDQSQEAHDNVLVTSPELKKGVRKIITKFQLKKRRNTRFTNTLKKKKKQNQLRSFFSEESNILQNDSAEMKNNHLKAQTIFQQIDTNNSMVSTNKIINQDEPSDFDKLLETKPNETSSKLNTFEQPLSKINFEDKSDDGSDIYHSACPSPLPSDSEDDGNIHMKKLSYVPVISPSVHCLKPSTEIQPNKILCSILKARVGKMLPYFGETTTDDEGLDEDTPLLLRFSSSNEIVNLSPIHEKSKISNSEEEIASDSHAVNLLTITKNPCVSEEPALQNNLRKSEKRVTRKCNVDSSNEENCEITSKEVEKDGGLLPLNGSSPVLLRKSTRKLKTINLLPQTNNYLQSNVDNLLTETKTLLTNDVKCGDESNLALSDQPVLPRKRGRPRKIKITEALDSIDELKVELVEKRHDEKKDPLHPSEDNETPLTEVTENVSFNKRRGRKPKNNTDSIENLSSRETIYGEIKNDDDNLDVLSDTLKVNHGSPRLELSDLDSAIQKSITLRQTRSRHTRLNKTPQKNYKNQINDSIQHEENMDIEEKLEFSSNDISNNLSTDKQVGTKRRGRKRKPVILNNNIQSLAEDKSSGILEGSNDSSVQIPSVTKKYELDTEEPYNEFPPALVKTRARRPRIAIPDNVYLEPPNLEIPYTSFSDVKSSENFDIDSALVKDSNEILSSKGRGRNVRQMLGLNTHSNGETDFLFTVVPKEVENALNENENSEKGNNKMCYPKQPHFNTEEKKTLPRKRGKKNKHKINCKKTCKESNFSENKTNPEADSDIEINIPMLQSDFTNSDNFEDGSCSDTENLIKPVLIVSEQNTEVVQRDLKRNTDSAESIEKKMSLAKESKKRTRNFTENVLMTESNNNPTQMLEDSEEREVNESAIKKLKTQDSEPIKNPESDEIDKSCTSSCHEPSTDVCVNQAFLWSKISGFLNKTTRSVGTQVKVKNMALKGFDTSEPEVSLQSELTLPQVIKTLFEELKSIDSSFLNP